MTNLTMACLDSLSFHDGSTGAAAGAGAAGAAVVGAGALAGGEPQPAASTTRVTRPAFSGYLIALALETNGRATETLTVELQARGLLKC